MKHHFAIFVSAAYVVGIFCAKTLWSQYIFLTALSLLLIASTYCLRKNILLVSILAVCIFGIAHTSLRLYIFDNTISTLYKTKNLLSGSITNIQKTPKANIATVALHSPKTSIKVLIKNNIKIGQDITITPPFNWSKKQPNIQQNMFLIANENNVQLGKIHWTLPRFLNWINQHCLSIHNKTLPKPYDTLLASLIFGNTTNPLPEDINEAYMRTGVIHLLVVSGAQVALLLGVFAKLCSLFKLSRTQAFIASSIFNLFFVLLTGAGPSISRAGIMAEFALLSQLAGRPQSFYHTLSLSAFVLLLFNPFYLFHIGFQLSFLATFALFYLAPIIEEQIKPYFGRISSPLSVSLAPLILSTPLIAFYFNRFSIMALPANLIVGAMVEILVFTGFFCTLLGMIGLFPLALFINQGNYILLVALNKIITFLSNYQHSQVNVSAPTSILLAAYYFFLLVGTEMLRKKVPLKKKHFLFITPLVLIIFFFNASFSSPQLTSPLQITAIDVGQGDAFLIKTPHKKILIDGGAYTKGNQSAIEHLAKLGINHLDGIIETHAHADHVDGLIPVIKNIKVDWVITSGFKSNYAQHQKFLYMIKKKKIPHHIAKPGQKIQLEKEITLQIIHPSEPFIIDTHSPDNDNSIVCRLVFGNFSMLFTGDVAKAGEERILEQGLPIKSTILKVGHHGSRWSTNPEFLDAVDPHIAIISCGQDNRFNHPHKEALERIKERTIKRYKDKKIKVYRTDTQGTITIGTDGENIIII